MNWQQKLETKSVNDPNQPIPMKKIILIAFCLFAIVSFSQELASVKVVESQTEKVVKSEQKEAPTTVVSEITKDTLSNTFKEPITTNATEVSGAIIASQGFSMKSLWRGVLGMISLLIIAFLFSSNRKAIDWKKVGIGLSLQLLIAIGVLKFN